MGLVGVRVEGELGWWLPALGGEDRDVVGVAAQPHEMLDRVASRAFGGLGRSADRQQPVGHGFPRGPGQVHGALHRGRARQLDEAVAVEHQHLPDRQ